MSNFQVIRDKVAATSTLVLNKDVINPDSSKVIVEFIQDCLKEREPLFGVYYKDINNQLHMLELRHQTMYTILIALQQFSVEDTVHIVFSSSEVPSEMLPAILKIPGWLIKLGQLLFILPKKYTYKDFVKIAYAKQFSGKNKQQS